MIKRKHKTIIIKKTTKKEIDKTTIIIRNFNLTQKKYDSFPNHVSKPLLPLKTMLPSSSTSPVS